MNPLTKEDLVCHHHNGYWNDVSADQFGEQTAIKMGKGGLKGTTLCGKISIPTRRSSHSSVQSCHWSDSCRIEKEMEWKFKSSKPGGFYKGISSRIKTVHTAKKHGVNKMTKPRIDLESIFVRL